MQVRAGILVFLYSTSVSWSQVAKYTHADGQQFLKKYCAGCHQGRATGGFDIAKLAATSSFRDRAESWSKAALRVHNGEMPPKSALPMDVRESFASWVRESLRNEACSAGILPGPAPLRRLSRAQYTTTIRDLLNVHVDIGSTLPADGAGGEGFDNAAETLFLSPIHAEKYLEAARLALIMPRKTRGRAPSS